MKQLNRLQIFLLLVAAIVTMQACQKDSVKTPLATEESFDDAATITVPSTSTVFRENTLKTDCNTFYGPTVQIGNGHARSWINISRSDKKPLAIGIEFSRSSLQNLPTNPLDFAASTFVLKLHPKAMEITPFDHITINWEPEGHEPAGIYDVPHFDMHFYKISVAAQLAITPFPTTAPAPGYLPASYVIEGATVPQMGTHWLDPSSPELPPTFTPFTHTFIYGSNNGQVIFLEPMITRAFLLGGSTVSKAIPQPIHFAPANTFYPKEYNIWKTAGNGRSYVALTNFSWR